MNESLPHLIGSVAEEILDLLAAVIVTEDFVPF
jgi:hypothetical protein